MGKKFELIERDEEGNVVSMSEISMPYGGEIPDAKTLVSSWSAHNVLKPKLDALSGDELRKFSEFAIEQGTKMPFSEVEKGIIAAGRKDMQNAIEYVLKSAKFDIPVCPICGGNMESCGRCKKKILTATGAVEISQPRYVCREHVNQVVYPMEGYIQLIVHEIDKEDGSKETSTVKCTPNAAASIAMVSAEMPYLPACQILNRLAGMNVDVMTGFRATDYITSKFSFEQRPVMDLAEIKNATERFGISPLSVRFVELDAIEDRDKYDKIVGLALDDKPEGITYTSYSGKKIRVMYVMPDGTGVPGRKEELQGVKGKQADGSAKTFEAKIGVVFIVEYTEDGKPLLNEDGTIYRDKVVKYVGTCKGSEEFGPMLYQHAVDNGMLEVDSVVFIGDGAKWIWNIQDRFFPNALGVIDQFHAIEHVNSMVDLLQFKGKGGADKKDKFKGKCIKLLRQGKIQEMLDLIDTMPCKQEKDAKLKTAKEYFSSNTERMKYGTLTACGIFVGSGVIEAGCKVIVGNRMEVAGARWKKANGENMIEFRCAIRNGDFQKAYPCEYNYKAVELKVAA